MCRAISVWDTIRFPYASEYRCRRAPRTAQQIVTRSTPILQASALITATVSTPRDCNRPHNDITDVFDEFDHLPFTSGCLPSRRRSDRWMVASRAPDDVRHGRRARSGGPTPPWVAPATSRWNRDDCRQTPFAAQPKGEVRRSETVLVYVSKAEMRCRPSNDFGQHFVRCSRNTPSGSARDGLPVLAAIHLPRYAIAYTQKRKKKQLREEPPCGWLCKQHGVSA